MPFVTRRAASLLLAGALLLLYAKPPQPDLEALQTLYRAEVGDGIGQTCFATISGRRLAYQLPAKLLPAAFVARRDTILTGVLSKGGNAAERQLVRRAWGNAATFFVVGKEKPPCEKEP